MSHIDTSLHHPSEQDSFIKKPPPAASRLFLDRFSG